MQVRLPAQNGLRAWLKQWTKPSVIITLGAPILWFVGWITLSNLQVKKHEKELIELQVALKTEISQRYLLQERIDRLDTPLSHRVEQIARVVDQTSASVAGNTMDLRLTRERLDRMRASIDALNEKLNEHLRHGPP